MDDPVQVLLSLSDPTRLRLVNVLLHTGAICVCELVQVLRLPQYAVSRHLRILAAADLVSPHRQGKWIYYGIHEKLEPYQRALLRAVALLGAERTDFSQDLIRAARLLRLRHNGVCCVGLAGRVRPRTGAQGWRSLVSGELRLHLPENTRKKERENGRA